MSSESTDVKSFIEEILETSVSDARVWFEALKKELSEGFSDSFWNPVLKIPVNAEIVESIAAAFSIQISKFARKVPESIGRRKIEEGHRFLKEISEKAKKRGLDVDPEKIDWIFAPGLEHIKDVLARMVI